MENKSCKTIEKLALAGALAVWLTPTAATTAQTQAAATHRLEEKSATTTGNKFYCNIKALNSTERAAHQKLTEKLLAIRTQTVEIDKGYELQFDPAAVSLAELAAWVADESKCCPFFDFHIDLERAGTLLCLRLNGEPGVKQFIETEFHISGK